MDAFKLEGLTIAGARAAVAERRISAVDLAEQQYERIAAIDGAAGQGINSYLALSQDRALEQAARVDAMVTAGESLGPLAGVPMAIKDVLAMRGAPATAGSKILAGYRPPYDATAVRKLEAAGAVLLGKLNCDEFAMGLIAFRAARAAGRRRPWQLIFVWRAWGPIPADQCGSRRRSAAWSACCRRMAV